MGAPAPKTIAFAIGGPVLLSDLPGLCDRVCALLDQQAGAGAAVCDVRGVEPDAVAVDALARLQVAAARRGCRITLRDASAELRALLRFLGLDDVLAEEPGASS